jgi:hypothetical protein
MRIADGSPEDHPTPLPLDPSATPGVQRPGAREPGGAVQGGTRDTVGERLSALSAAEAAIGAAQSAGMAASADRRGHYEASMAPLGASAGDAMSLPDVPAYTLPPPPLAGYPWSGDEPVG